MIRRHGELEVARALTVFDDHADGRPIAEIHALEALFDLRVVVGRLEEQSEQEAEGVRLRGCQLLVKLDEARQLAGRIRLRQNLRAGAGLPRAHSVVHHREQEVFLVREMPEDGALAGLGLFRDQIEGRARVASGGKQAGGDVDDVAAGLFALLFPLTLHADNVLTSRSTSKHKVGYLAVRLKLRLAGHMAFRAAVIGGSGYGGGEIMRRLLVHPEVELVRVASIDFPGEPVWRAHPTLEGRTALRFEDIGPAEAAKDVDVVFLGLPHKVSALKVPELVASGVRMIDLSGDFRLKDAAAYERYYGQTHPCPELLPKFVYGLPELNRDRIRDAQWVASPGCFATTIALALLPFAQSGWLTEDVKVVAMTGSSGSGVRPSPGTHHPTRAVNLKTYKNLAHQHTPEILETVRAAGAGDIALEFVPVSAPLARGILASAFVSVPDSVDEEKVQAALRASYDDECFVRVPTGRLAEVAAVAGAQFAEVSACVGPPRSGRRTVNVVSALDNLIKGGAGQAIQSMNIMLGLPEMLALEDPGAWP